jgi:biopolymer transport protein ExbD
VRRGFACGILLLCAGACRPKACDDAELQHAVAQFEDHSADGRVQAFDALANACPALPDGLHAELRSRFLPDASVMVAPVGDQAYAALFRRTCPELPAEPDALLESDDFDDALRLACDVDRYGVLRVDEPFVRDDIVAFMLFEWLTTTGADPWAARTIARALMYVDTSQDERELACKRQDEGCEYYVAGLDVVLPRSTSNSRIQPAVDLMIASTGVSVEGEPVDEGFERHVSRGLLATLEARTERAALLHADAGLPFATFANVAFTANKAGYEEIDVAVHAERSLRRIPLAVPRAWLSPREWPRMERSLELEVHVHRNALELKVGGGGPGTRFEGVPGCASSAPECLALADEMKKYKKLFPHETVATFVTDDDVPMQDLVAVMDIVRGLECELPLDGGAIPDTCLWWQAIVETSPPLFWNIDRIQAIRLGEPTFELREAGGVKPKPLLRAIASSRETIEACLLANLPLLRDLGDDIFLAVARAPDGKLVAHVLDKAFADQPQERCVLDPLGLALPIHDGNWDFFRSVGVEITIPVTLDLR